MSETTGNSETGDYPKSEQHPEPEERSKAGDLSEPEQDSAPEEDPFLDFYQKSNEYFDVDAFQSLYDYLESLLGFAKSLDTLDKDCFEDYRDALPRFYNHQQLISERDQIYGLKGKAKGVETSDGQEIMMLVRELAFAAFFEADEDMDEELLAGFDNLQALAGDLADRTRG